MSPFLAGSPLLHYILDSPPGRSNDALHWWRSCVGGGRWGGEEMQQKGKPRKGGKMVSPLNMSKKEPFFSRLFMSPSSSQFNLSSSSAHLSTFTHFTHPSRFFLLWPPEQVSERHTKLHYFPLTWVCRRSRYLAELNMDLAEMESRGCWQHCRARNEKFPGYFLPPPTPSTYLKNVGVSINKSEGTVRSLIKAISAVFRGERPRC